MELFILIRSIVRASVEQFQYLGTTLTNQNPIDFEAKSRLKSGNACYHSVQNLLSSSLLSKSVKIKTYRTIILPVVLYGCKIWSLKLREDCRVRVFENRALRRTFRPKRDEVTRQYRRLKTEELYALYSSPDSIRVIKSRRLIWAGHVACMGEIRGAQKVLVGKAEGRRPLGRCRHIWEDNITMDFREVGLEGMDWINLAPDRDRWRALVNAIMNFRFS